VVERALRFLVSRKSLVGFALVGIGMALNVLGLLPMGPFWLTVAVGLYVLGAVVTPKERGPEVRLDAAADTAAIRDGLDELLHRVRFKVAPDILDRVESIRKQILAMLERSPDRNTGDPTVYLIRQTAIDYLPSALAAYLEMPRVYAERRRVAGGRTAHDVLLEQLVVMDARLHEAHEAMIAHDSDRLLENARFLADRFGTSGLRIDEPAGEARDSDAVAATEPAAASTAEPAAEATAPPAADAVEERERVR